MIRYDTIYLHGKIGCADTNAMKLHLSQNNISFVTLDYVDPSDDLAAVSTWFESEPDFRDAPVLTFEKLLWEGEDDGTPERYSKTMFATTPSGLPDNFVELAEKVS